VPKLKLLNIIGKKKGKKKKFYSPPFSQSGGPENRLAPAPEGGGIVASELGNRLIMGEKEKKGRGRHVYPSLC